MIDVSRLEESKGWLGSKNRDPGLDPDECPRCGGDGERGGRYCSCQAGRELLQSQYVPEEDAWPRS